MIRRPGFAPMAGRHSLPMRNPPADWNPMVEDFYDPNFNNYNYGPGSRLDMNLQPWNPRKEEKREYKLYVQNIPEELSGDGLFNCFLNRHAAPPREVFISPPIPGTPVTWGFVYYDRQSDAEYAIRAVSGKPPLHLKVQFARSDEEKSRLRSVVHDEDRWKTSLAVNPYAPVDGRDQFVQRMNMRRRPTFPSRLSAPGRGFYRDYDEESCDYYSDDDLDFDGFSTFRETSAVRMSRQALECADLTIQCDGGERRVSLGRGYFRGDQIDGPESGRTPPVNQSRIGPSERVTPHSTHLSGNYESGELPDFKEGRCGLCKVLTTKQCGHCEQWYCSRECQMRDWTAHQPVCQSLPPLQDSRSKAESSRRTEGLNGNVERDSNNGESPNGSSFVPAISRTPETDLISKTEALSLDEKRKGILGDHPGVKKENDGLLGDYLGRDKIGHTGRLPNSSNDFLHDKKSNNQRHRRQELENQNQRRTQGNRAKSSERFGGGRNDKRGNGNQRPRNDDNRQNFSRPSGNNDRRDSSRRNVNSRSRNDERYDGGNEEYNNSSFAHRQNSVVVHKDQKERSTGNAFNDDSCKGSADLTNSVSNHNLSGETNSCDGSGSHNERQTQPCQSKDGEKLELRNAKPCSTGAIPKSRSRASNVSANGSDFPLPTSSERTSEVLPTGVFTEVKVVLPVGSTDYWVQLKSRETDYLNLMRELFSVIEDLPSAELKVGGLCACLFEEIWCRARVLALTPQLEVQYIDYGNSEVVHDARALKSLPPQALELPGQAIRIKLADGTPEKWWDLREEESLFVKPVGAGGEIEVVHVEGSNYDAEATMKVNDTCANSYVESKDDLDQAKSSSKVESGAQSEKKLLNSSVCLLECGMCGYLQYQVSLEPGKFVASIACEEFADSFRTVTEGLQDSACSAIELCNPEPRDLVLAKSSETDFWLRAYVLSVKGDGCLVAFCDTGEVERVKEVKELGSDLQTIYGMAVQCSVLDYILKPEAKARELLKASKKFKFEVIGTSDTAAQVFLKVQDGEKPFCRAKLSAWLPPFKPNLKCVPLKDGPCILSTFQSPKDMFVRPVDKNSLTQFARIVQDLNGLCHRLDSLDHMPSIGDFVAGKFSGDGNYYRALVRNIDERDIRVSYVDFGNSEILSLDRLKPLDEELKSYPCFALKVILNDVVDQPLNKEVVEFFSDVVNKELELKMKVVDVQSKFVELHLPDGTSVNEKVNTLMEPSWKKKSSANIKEELFMYNEMPVVQLPLRDVKLGIQQVLTCNQLAVANMEKPDLLENVQGTMVNTMNTYCTETDQKSYVPRQGETCLANFQGEWYRAVCVGSGPGFLNVMFIDYGNFSEVKHTDVRKMVKEFYETPALTCLCKIRGIEEDHANKEKIQERFFALIPPESVVTAKVVGKTEDLLHYEIELPHVISTLSNEGLL